MTGILLPNGRVERRLGSAREYIYRSSNGVGGHSLSRLCPPISTVSARDVMAWYRWLAPYGGLDAELQAWGTSLAVDVSDIVIWVLGFCSSSLISSMRHDPSVVVSAAAAFLIICFALELLYVNYWDVIKPGAKWAAENILGAQTVFMQ